MALTEVPTVSFWQESGISQREELFSYCTYLYSQLQACSLRSILTFLLMPVLPSVPVMCYILYELTCQRVLEQNSSHHILQRYEVLYTACALSGSHK
jgi:hypothetical protein